MATQANVRRRAAGPGPLVLVLALALLVAVGGAIWYFTRPAPQPPGPVRPPGTIAVPVAARALNKGTELEGAGLIRPMYLRPEQVPVDAILQPNAMLSRVTQVGLRPGEYFSEAKLAPPGAPNGFSGLLRPGHRMVVMNMAAVGSVTRFLREGDLVDIVAYNAPPAAGRNRANLVATGNSLQPGTAAPSVANRNAAPLGEPGLSLVAQAVRIVIAPPPPPRQAPRNRRAPVPSQDAALEVHEDDAATLQLTMATGRPIQFVHRAFNDTTRIDPVEARLARMPRDPRQIEVIEGDTRRTMSASYD